MLISDKNDRVDFNFFPSKEAYPIVRQLEKIMVKKWYQWKAYNMGDMKNYFQPFLC